MEYDPSQVKVIEAQKGFHLVLAPPGCGKTQILTERIKYAHTKLGVEYGDMLCLTFTNRAARGMKERIRTNIDDREVERVYVGNVHRFCSRFLFEYALIPAETSVIDDDDAISILARYFEEDEAFVTVNYRRKKEYFDVLHLAAYMYQIEHEHGKDIRLHPECLSPEEVGIIKQICESQTGSFSREAMLDIYHNADRYRDLINTAQVDIGIRSNALPVLRKLEAAHFYVRYKQENRLVDFEDLLLLAYDALSHDDEGRFKHYPWVQVDEVQDLNPLQLRIIDLLSIKFYPQGSYMYLGDEQQAIFSFMGAKMTTLQMLKERSGKNVHRLTKNHRSPKYLQQVFNHYAYHVLGIQKDMLPTSDSEPIRSGNELSFMVSNTFDNEYSDVAQQAQRLASQNPDETTAVIVTSNADADLISARMNDMNVGYFKVSGTDIFSLPEVKLVLAHLAVFANEHNFIAWARLLKGLRVYEQAASARGFVRELMERALLPTDLLLRENGSYVMDFEQTCREKEIVVFDTETTGLNVLEDDIVQIAAMKMKGGAVVPGSEFSVYIHTDREIPLMLGDIENPIIEEMKNHQLLSHEEALQQFMDYIGDGILLGHNADYDYNILDANLKRYLPQIDLRTKCPYYFDTLKLTRLLEPNLHQYKLKHLLEVLHLEGENSHLADADVAATCNVVAHCLQKAQEVIPQQQEFLARKTVKDRSAAFRKAYRQYYLDTLERLYSRQEEVGGSMLVGEMNKFYDALVEEAIIQPVKGFAYIGRYIDKDIVNVAVELTLKEQLASHNLEISTLKESDLCSNDVVDERVFVTTVHKAKGLEFDNVIVFDVAADRYPGFYTRNDPVMRAEDARKLYVALTRAKKRIMLAVSAEKRDYHNNVHRRNYSPFLTPVMRFFTTYKE